MNPFKYSFDNKRYHTLNYYYQNKFKTRVSKISLDANFTCPNIDGKVGYGGCIYCKQAKNTKSLLEQFNDQKIIIDNKWPNSKYIGFFQSNTNTYDSLPNLREKYELILNQDNVIGLSISTRPDSISNELLDYLEYLNKRTFLTIELGLQTIHEETAKLINRCHSLDCFNKMIIELRKRNINVVVHIINGLPYETKEMMLETVKYLSKLDIQGLKIHMLHIVKDTPLEKLYNKDKFHILTREEYVNIVCDQLELLRENIVIHRLTGDPIKDDLIKPLWVLKKVSVLNDIDKELVRRNTYQDFNKSILNKFRQILINHLNYNDLVVESNIGNGKDTLFLSNLVDKGHVYGFDIKDEALSNTKLLLDENNKKNYTLFKISNEYIYKTLSHLDNKISAIIFNKINIKDIKNSLKLLNKKGIILILINNQNKEEISINKYLKSLSNEYIIDYYSIDKESLYLIKIKRP